MYFNFILLGGLVMGAELASAGKITTGSAVLIPTAGQSLDSCKISGTLVLDRGEVSGNLIILTINIDKGCPKLPAGRLLVLRPFSSQNSCGSVTHRGSLHTNGAWTYGVSVTDDRNHLCNGTTAKQFNVDIFSLDQFGLPEENGVRVILEGDLLEDAPGGSGAHA